MFGKVITYQDKVEGKMAYRISLYEQNLDVTLSCYNKVNMSDFKYRHKLASIVAYGLNQLAKKNFYLPYFKISCIQLDHKKYPRINVTDGFAFGSE